MKRGNRLIVEMQGRYTSVSTLLGGIADRCEAAIPATGKANLLGSAFTVREVGPLTRQAVREIDALRSDRLAHLGAGMSASRDRPPPMPGQDPTSALYRLNGASRDDVACRLLELEDLLICVADRCESAQGGSEQGLEDALFISGRLSRMAERQIEDLWVEVDNDICAVESRNAKGAAA